MPIARENRPFRVVGRGRDSAPGNDCHGMEMSFKNLFIIMKMGVAQNRPETPWEHPIFGPECDPLQGVPIAHQNRPFFVVNGGRNSGPE